MLYATGGNQKLQETGHHAGQGLQILAG